nr:FAD-dependent monooxygenase [Marinigracilibium pacificum]
MKFWWKNKICLIGDAAHATTPNMGQGGAQAIEDAYCLSRLIAEGTVNNHFGEFQEKRYSKVNKIVNQSFTIGKMAHMKFGKPIRNFLLKNTPNKMMEKMMLEMYSVEDIK